MKTILNRLNLFFSSLREAEKIEIKISRFGLGVLIFQVINKSIIVLINPVILFLFEIKTALFFMIIVSLIIRYSLIKIYDKQKIDWFGIEKFKQWYAQWDRKVLPKEKQIIKKRIVIFILRKGGKYLGYPLLILFFIVYDPFLLVIWLRKGNNAWDNIPNIFTLFFFVLSAIMCACISALWEKPLVELLRNFLFG